MDNRMGNQWWKLRSKHGRDKIFSSGETILEACDEYMTMLNDAPLLEHDFVGKDAIEVQKNKKHVPTWAGFSIFCGVHIGYFQQLRQDYKKSDDPVKKDIYDAVMRVDSIFYHDKFSHASAGLANPSLIGKELNIVEKIDHTTNGKDLPSTSPSITIEIVKPDSGE